jgi:hypothetical protein
MTSFSESYEHQELLQISKQHLDSLDNSRISDDAVIGTDNVAKLKVATVFAAIAIEAALNDFILGHCLLVGGSYLQQVFGELARRFARGSVFHKVSLLSEHWSDPFPQPLVADVRRLFEIRNKVIHQSGEFSPRGDATGDRAVLTNRPLTNAELEHMRRHHDIALDFLSRFWLPGARELGALPDVERPR